MTRYIAVIGRWKPPHNGHEQLLNSLCSRYNHVYIGIGSANIYSSNNPFTPKETEAMIRLILPDHNNYTTVFIDDKNNGKLWKEDVVNKFSDADTLVSGNPYVMELLKEHFTVISPESILPENQRINTKGSVVRQYIASGQDYFGMIPYEVLKYITMNGLDIRISAQFGRELRDEAVVPQETVEGEKHKIGRGMH